MKMVSIYYKKKKKKKFRWVVRRPFKLGARVNLPPVPLPREGPERTPTVINFSECY